MAQDTKPVLFRLPPNLLRRLSAAARSQGRSRNAEVARRVEDGLKAKKQVGAQP